MDDTNFHQQLHSLRDRVNALTMQYSPQPALVAPAATAAPLPPVPYPDQFTAQLNDVKSHLNTLQMSISQCEASMRQQRGAPPPQMMDNEMTAQNRLTLPSGPVFWQLFNSLRSDFQSLDTRVAGLEQDVDALEDRVDRLEPDRFTPPGSTSSQEDAGGVQITQQQQSNHDLLGASMTGLPELCSEGKDGLGAPVGSLPNHSRISSLQSQPVDAFEWQCPPGNYSAEGNLPQSYVQQDFGSIYSCHPNDPVCNLVNKYRQTSGYGQGVVNKQTSIYPEGVAFRDREIDRMDDQLKVVQESLRSSEALAAAKDTTMGDMQSQIEALQADNQRLTAKSVRESQTKKGHETLIRMLRNELESIQRQFKRRDEEQQKKIDGHWQTVSDLEQAVRYWQERCEQEASNFHQTIAERDRALQRWEESYNAASETWRQDNEQMLVLGTRFDEYRTSRRNEIEQLHHSYQREMDKLKEFCEHKDAVIGKQERVISRGGRLLEERDTEIDRLQRRLRVAEDDVQHESRQQKRMARLLDETQTELERLRSTIEMREKSADGDSLAAQEEETMAASTEAVDGREPMEIPGSYAREARRSTDRRRERHRDNDDDSDASAREAARTGSPHRRRLRRHDSSRHLRTHHRGDDDRRQRHERRPTPPPRPHGIPDRDDRGEQHGAEKSPAQPDPRDRRHARFLEADGNAMDGFAQHPPPVSAARKIASEADLRSRRGGVGEGRANATARGERSLSKHQSMQELPRRRQLQAYVETEAESDAERESGGPEPGSRG